MTGAEMKAMREKRGMRQIDLADRLQVSNGTISNWENGRTPIPFVYQTAINVYLNPLDSSK